MIKISFALTVALGCSVISAQAQTAPAPQSTRPGPERRMMAPPPETRLVPKLRPSTAASGLSHDSKPPIKELPAFGSAGKGTDSSGKREGHWLLLYRSDNCVSCDRMMKALAASQSPDLREGVPYTVIVGGRSTSAVSDVRAAYNTLTNALWVADPDNKIYASLQLHGAPMLFGMNGNHVIWRQAGTLGDPQAVMQRADAWIAGTAAAAAEKAKNGTKTPAAAAASQPTTAGGGAIASPTSSRSESPR